MFKVRIATHWICSNATLENGGTHGAKPCSQELSSPRDWIAHTVKIDRRIMHHIPEHNIVLLGNAHVGQGAQGFCFRNEHYPGFRFGRTVSNM
jgi:hypothetical protein